MTPVALGGNSYLLVGSEGGRSAAVADTLLEKARLTSVDPLAWLTDILGRMPDHKVTRIDDLLPGVPRRQQRK